MAMVAAMCLLAACTDELVVQGTPTGRYTPQGEIVDASLDLTVSTLSVSVGTRESVDESLDDTEEERWVNDIWVFEYDYSTGDLILPPIYLTIEDQQTLSRVPVELSDNDGKACVVYVVANTNDSTWVDKADTGNTDTGNANAVNEESEYEGFNSLESLKAKTIPNPAPIRIDSDSDTDSDGNDADSEDDSNDSEDNSTEEAHLCIPMGGSVGEDGTLIIKEDDEVKVPIERMFAKLVVNVTLIENNDDYSDASMTSLAIDKILNACAVATTYDGDNAWVQPANSKFEVTRTFNDPVANKNESEGSESYGPLILYVPENLSGTNYTNAIKIIPYIKAVDTARNAEILSKPYYTVYPGSWSNDDESAKSVSGENYNIQRNCIYNVNLTINLEKEPVTPSANCLIATAGQTIAFYPYVRDEEMNDDLKELAATNDSIRQRYNFSTYLNYSYRGDSINDGKKIKSVKIIWQTEDCIGDNSDGSLVWIEDAPDEKDYEGLEWTDDAKKEAMTDTEYRRKIYVKVQNTGNALIAAYDNEDPDDASANILWSWHIWVPEVDPEANAIEYYHYAWNSSGIDTTTYIPGRLVMNMNLGAVKEKPDDNGDNYTETFGTLYQWGRKDPFPAMKMTATPLLQYWQPIQYDYQYADCTFSHQGNFSVSTTYTVKIGVYDNANNWINLSGYNGSIYQAPDNLLFYTEAPDYAKNTDSSTGKAYEGHLNTLYDDPIILETVRHPTMFVAAGDPSGSSVRNTYFNHGDWLPCNDDYLWGGMKSQGKYTVYDSIYVDKDNGYYTANLEDNYGPEKTIFDPCPYGWRVAPGDLWLGFTKDGKNWHYNPENKVSALDHMDEVNIATTAATTLKQHGFTMYMQGWHGAIGTATSFFPLQGVRVVSGQPYGDISCGNYHNATAEDRMIYDGVSSHYKNQTNLGMRRVDIIHFHCNSSTEEDKGDNIFIKVFVDDNFFYEKALACPLRCVRDTK